MEGVRESINVFSPPLFAAILVLILHRCLSHVGNLAVTDTMSMITKKAALETTQAIWEYDPSDPNNRVLGGSLDVIAALRTLSTKIQASGQRIQEFHKTQHACGIKTALSLILHSNTRWGSAYGMVDRGLKLSTVCNIFLSFSHTKFTFSRLLIDSLLLPMNSMGR